MTFDATEGHTFIWKPPKDLMALKQDCPNNTTNYMTFGTTGTTEGQTFIWKPPKSLMALKQDCPNNTTNYMCL
ncbi:MAG: hypothetical protein DRR08_32475 [Candidatus Parabeggiatoa sp. nov. 2]|nr:MAG: hypothetical protein DRR08_32475 [Gammaproteobacteria bacterium]